jgi:hypothetical protein
MYYFAIEAQERIGYTLAALRCEAKIFENQQLANSNWQLAGKNQTLPLIHTDDADQARTAVNPTPISA